MHNMHLCSPTFCVTKLSIVAHVIHCGFLFYIRNALLSVVENSHRQRLTLYCYCIIIICKWITGCLGWRRRKGVEWGWVVGRKYYMNIKCFSTFHFATLSKTATQPPFYCCIYECRKRVGLNEKDRRTRFAGAKRQTSFRIHAAQRSYNIIFA